MKVRPRYLSSLSRDVYANWFSVGLSVRTSAKIVRNDPYTTVDRDAVTIYGHIGTSVRVAKRFVGRINERRWRVVLERNVNLTSTIRIGGNSPTVSRIGERFSSSAYVIQQGTTSLRKYRQFSRNFVFSPRHLSVRTTLTNRPTGFVVHS